jgi:hypothetical protein
MLHGERVIVFDLQRFAFFEKRIYVMLLVATDKFFMTFDILTQ